MFPKKNSFVEGYWNFGILAASNPTPAGTLFKSLFSFLPSIIFYFLLDSLTSNLISIYYLVRRTIFYQNGESESIKNEFQLHWNIRFCQFLDYTKYNKTFIRKLNLRWENILACLWIPVYFMIFHSFIWEHYLCAKRWGNVSLSIFS